MGSASERRVDRHAGAHRDLTFWASLSNSCGSIQTRLVTITVGSSCTVPTIVVEPLSQKISKNTSANLSVVATGTAPLSYQWYEGSASTDTKPVGTSSSLYTTVSLAKTTKFWVRVTNSCGTDDSATATLSIPARRRAVRK